MNGRWLAALAWLAVFPGLAATASAGEAPADAYCGMSPNDWCPSPPGDPCGVHHDTETCRADSKCYGMPYRGESVVACISDERGFASNCPTVGCTSVPPEKSATAPR
jgi:hypothetical protein